MHTFRFADPSQVISLSQEQLERIPYLFEMVSSTDPVSSNRNERGEWLLDCRIRYAGFTAILASVTARRSSFLFTKLPQRCDVFCMLKLRKFLRIDPLPVSSFAQTQSEIDDELFFQTYCRMRPSAVRDSAVEFALAIAMDKYDFHGSANVKNIVYLLEVILSHGEFFGVRLRYHTLAIVKACCSSAFSSKQMSRLQAYKCSSLPDDEDTTDEEDDHQHLFLRSEETLYWREESDASKEKQSLPVALRRSEPALETEWRYFLQSNYAAIPFTYPIFILDDIHVGCFSRLRKFSPGIQLIVDYAKMIEPMLHALALDELKIANEPKWARAGFFTMLPPRPMYDQCKHRSKAKAQKHR